MWLTWRCLAHMLALITVAFVAIEVLANPLEVKGRITLKHAAEVRVRLTLIDEGNVYPELPMRRCGGRRCREERLT